MSTAEWGVLIGAAVGLAGVFLPFAFTVSTRLAAISTRLDAIESRLASMQESTQRMWNIVSEHDRDVAVLMNAYKDGKD